MFVTLPLSVILQAAELLESGLDRGAVASRLEISPATVRRWSRGGWPRAARPLVTGEPFCPRCLQRAHHFAELPAAAYAHLLGLYLGDGCVAPLRSTYQLRITMDSRYPGIIGEAVESVRTVVPSRRVGAYPVRGQRCVNVTACEPGWPCLLPQHAPGKKQDRPVRLEPWQQEIVDAHPGRFLRGLVQSDGWRGENRVHVKGRDYSYPRYQFSSRSDDIRRLFTDACDRVGVAWRPWGRWHISVARRDAVALLDEHVGPKR